MNTLHKDWVKHITIACGVLVGIWIIVGFIGHMRYFLSIDYSEDIRECENCLTEADNNYQQTVPVSSLIVLELPSALYASEDLVILQEPEDSLIELGKVAARSKKNWAVQFEALKEGYIDIVVPGKTETVPDYHTVIIIE